MEITPSKSENRGLSVSKQTTITLGLVMVLMASAVAGAFRLGSWVSRMDDFESKTIIELQLIRGELQRISADRWTRESARAYHEVMGIVNPQLSIPPISPQGQ